MDPDDLRRELKRLVDKVAREAKERGLRGRTVTVILRYDDFETVSRRVTQEQAVAGAAELRGAAYQCFDRFSLDRPVRLLGVRLSKLEKGRGRKRGGRP